VGILKTFNIFLIILVTVGLTTAIEEGNHVRIWVNGGDNTLTYVGDVVSVDEETVSINAEQSYTGYTESVLSSYSYGGANPLDIKQNAIFASRIEPKDTENRETPGFAAILGVVAIVGARRTFKKHFFI
jgi:hypothetical protein